MYSYSFIRFAEYNNYFVDDDGSEKTDNFVREWRQPLCRSLWRCFLVNRKKIKTFKLNRQHRHRNSIQERNKSWHMGNGHGKPHTVRVLSSVFSWTPRIQHWPLAHNSKRQQFIIFYHWFSIELSNVGGTLMRIDWEFRMCFSAMFSNRHEEWIRRFSSFCVFHLVHFEFNNWCVRLSITENLKKLVLRVQSRVSK